MKKIVIFLAFVIAFLYTYPVLSREIPYTQDDRDRLIRVETKVEEGLKAVNQRIDGLEKRIDGLEKSLNQRIDDLKTEVRDLKTFMLWGFGILFGGMGILIGFVIWDRRTALAPSVNEIRIVKEVLKEAATKDENLAQALKHAGLL